MFQSCANLYGVIHIQDVWDIYEDCARRNDYPKIRRSKLLKFSGIARREELPYYVYEVNEIHSEEIPKAADRMIIRRDVVTPGYYKLNFVYSIDNNCVDYPLYIPHDILAFLNDPAVPEEIQVLHFLDQLVSTAPEIKDSFQTMKVNPYLGKALKDFCLETSEDRDMNELYEDKKGVFANHWKQKVSTLKTLSASERILKEYKDGYKLCNTSFTDNLRMLTEDLKQAGVELTFDELNTLMQMLSKLHNSMHSWYMRGWAPSELSKHMPAGGTPIIQFGANIEKMIENGTYSREELVKMIEEKGFKVSGTSKYGRS